jgi:hypothetical protein
MFKAASKHAQVYTGNMSRCKCGYRLGEGYQNCKACVDHNAQHPAGRRAPISESVAASDEDFDMRKGLPKRPFGQGVSKSARMVHQQAVDKVLKRAAINQHVTSAKPMTTSDKAHIFIAGIPVSSPVVPAAIASAVTEAPSSSTAAAPAAAPVATMQTRQQADQMLANSGWRRCFIMERNFKNPNLEHDDYDVVFSPRDGDCLFHCFIAILVQHGKVNFEMDAKDPKHNVFSMRSIVADFFSVNNNNIVCNVSDMEIHFQCESIESIRSGKGGKNAYGGVNEIVAFGLLYDLAVTVFCPETSQEIVTYNPGNFPEEKLLYTLGWKLSAKQVIRNGSTDHWQRVKPKQVLLQPAQAPVHSVAQQVSSDPLVSVLPQQEFSAVQQVPLANVPQPQQESRKEAAKKLALAERQQQDDAACEQARQFMASGGKFDFTEPQHACDQTVVHLVLSGDESDNACRATNALDDDAMEAARRASDALDDDAMQAEGRGKEDTQGQDRGDDGNSKVTHWVYRKGDGEAWGSDVEGPSESDDDAKEGRGEENKQGVQVRGDDGKRKITHWVHRTRITCLRLIQRLNPFAAKDSGLMWQQIADQIHKDTENVTEVNARGKSVNCQVHSDGTALMMWHRRQLAIMEKSFDAGAEKTKSGQAGMSKKAAASRSEETGAHQDEIEAEWEVLRSLKALHEDANRAAKMRKQKVEQVKELKNHKLPDEVQKTACDDEPVRLALIVELERRMKMCEQEAKTLTAAGRFHVMTEQQKQEHKMLAEMKGIQKAKKKSEGADTSEDEEAGTGGGTTSDARGRGKNNLKLSFDAMTQKMSELTEAMKQDIEQERPMSVSQVQSLLSDLDEDIKCGLRLEGDERQQLRMMILKQFAKSKKPRLE